MAGGEGGEPGERPGAPRNPAEFLQAIRGRPVSVKLATGAPCPLPLPSPTPPPRGAPPRPAPRPCPRPGPAAPRRPPGGSCRGGPAGAQSSPAPGRGLTGSARAGAAGADFRGNLTCLDGYMNIAMEHTEEYVDGQLKNKYGDCFIRGNNVLYLSPRSS